MQTIWQVTNYYNTGNDVLAVRHVTWLLILALAKRPKRAQTCKNTVSTTCSLKGPLTNQVPLSDAANQQTQVAPPLGLSH